MAKKLELKDLLEIIPSLTHEDFMELRKEVLKEYEERKAKAANTLDLLNGGK